MFMEGLGLEANDRANKAALLLAHERYSTQYAAFVKGNPSRLSYVEPQIDALLEECASLTNADPDYVKDRFAVFLRETVKSEIPADSTGIKNDTPSSMDEFVKTDVMDRGEVPDAGRDESLSDIEKQDLGQSTAARSDYEHWNEDADRMWWEEEGKHPYEPEYDDLGAERGMEAEDAAWEALYDQMYDLPPDDLHAIVAGTYSGPLPGAEGLDPVGVRDMANNVLSELNRGADPAEFAERGLRGGKCARCNKRLSRRIARATDVCADCTRELIAKVKQGDSNWTDGDLLGPTGTGTGLGDPSEQGLVQPQNMQADNTPVACKYCNAPFSPGDPSLGSPLDQLLQHVKNDHADVLQREQQAQQQGIQPPQQQPFAAAKEANPEPTDVAEVQPLPQTPGDRFDNIVQDLAERAAARHFSKPSDADYHALAQQLGVDEAQIRENLIAQAVFGNYAGVNGELTDDATPPDGYEPVQLQNGSSDAHQAQIPTDLVVGKVAEDMNLDDSLATEMIRDHYGDDLPAIYNANVQGQQTFYLPSGLAGNQDQTQQPANYDPSVGPAFQQTPPGAPVPAQQPGLVPPQQ